MFEFTIQASQGSARAGMFKTPHGYIQTPIFAPVGTQATVKTLTPAQLEELDASLVLANTYHLYLRPGDELIRDMGGLHEFMHWSRPILTDSGGFQVFSLSDTRKIDDNGVKFKSHIDGSFHIFTPEKSIQIQENLGADIIMSFDECSNPKDRTYSHTAMDRTHQWAERSIIAHTNPNQAIFGIIQGGIDPELRAESTQKICSYPFSGIAIGGLSVGETKEEMRSTLDIVCPLIPIHKPRYLMGVGTPEDLLDGIARGIDIFDCVLPTRLARHNAAFSSEGRINLMNAVYARDQNPIDSSCSCYTCSSFTRAYLRHLITSKETLAGTLLSIHNLHSLIQLANDIRASIIDQTFDAKLPEWKKYWAGNAKRIHNPEGEKNK